MNSGQITTSAALYFGAAQGETVPLSWFERAREVFTGFGLSPILFSAEGGGFLIDDCYVLAPRGRDLVAGSGHVLAARAEDLVTAIRSGVISSLGLDSPRNLCGWRSEWRADVSVSSFFGEMYVGVDENLVPDPSDLLRRAYAIARDLLGVCYGIAYKMPLAEEPSCYAIGRTKQQFSLSVFREELRAKREGTYRETKSVDDLWADELMGRRRHLDGLFRGAYPANVLSESHLRKTNLRLWGIGRLSELDVGLWLWELTDSEIPIAEELLNKARALVRQTDEEAG